VDTSTAVHISIEEYLNADYEPDCDYVDGRLEERNVGGRRHSRTQVRLAVYLRSKELEHEALISQDVKVSPSRIRIPDICLVEKGDRDEVVGRPPALWVEVLSPEDSWSKMQAKIDDALRFGVPTIWIIDPYAKEAWIATPDAPVTSVGDGKLRCADLKLEVELSEIWPEE
jgi:Uma2 family endonuclease